MEDFVFPKAVLDAVATSADRVARDTMNIVNAESTPEEARDAIKQVALCFDAFAHDLRMIARGQQQFSTSL